MFDTPILFLIFNRPENTEKVFNIIRQIQPRHLFVAADGARAEVDQDINKCSYSRAIINEGVDWGCDLKLLYREKNLGCGEAVSSAIAWFFENVEEGIILEDDTIPDISFFYYCEQLLDIYRNDKQIWSISGCNFGAENFKNGKPYTFARYMNMWGWATWRRSYQKVDYSLKNWKGAANKEIYTSILVQDNFFDHDKKWFEYWLRNFDLVANKKIDTWDFQWIYSQLLHKQLTIYPSINLIENIGFNEDATHTLNINHSISKIKKGTFKDVQLARYSVTLNKEFQNKFIKNVWWNVTYDKTKLSKIVLFKLKQLKYQLINGRVKKN